MIYPIIFVAICYLTGYGALRLAKFYQSVGIINQAYDLEQMGECIVRYGKDIGLIVVIIFIVGYIWLIIKYW